jgi:hypothetical protein
MSKKKSKSSGTSSQTGTSTTTLDPWSKAQFENQTKGILDATTNYTQSSTPTVTGLTPDEIRARQIANGSVGNWQGILSDATTGATAGMNYDASDPSKYYNPYEQDVVDSYGAYFDEQLAKQLNEQNDAVAQRGAFGNVSRDLGEAELRRGALADRARAMADLKYSGYKDAVQTGFQDAANKYQGAGILGQLAGTKQQLSQNDVAMLSQLGATEREIADAQQKGELDKLLLELQVRQGILGSTPFGSTTNSSGNATQTGKTSSSGISFGFGPQGFSIGG